MKKLLILPLLALPLIACADETATDVATAQDHAYVKSLVADQPALATGARNDFIIELPVTDELVAIAAKQKNAMFLSIDDPKQYIKDGMCLLNVVPSDAMDEADASNSKCNYRLFCGMPDDMNYDALYAVALCEE